MEQFIDFGDLSVSHGHWSAKNNEPMRYVPGNIKDEQHPHFDLQKFFRIPSKLSSIRMHEFFAEHGKDGSYKVSRVIIPHGDVKNLANQIEELLKEKVHHTSERKGSAIIHHITVPLTSVRGKVVEMNGECLYIVMDHNHSPVCSSLRRYRGKEKTLARIIKDISLYLAHEHHRASFSIHGSGMIYHCPDHIPHNVSPLEYWPDAITMVFSKTPPIVKFEKGDE